jgi:chromosome segregation ATPase
MNNTHAKLFLTITFLFIGWSAFSQEKTDSNNHVVKDTTSTKTPLAKEKSVNSDDQKKPLNKKDLNELTKQLEKLTTEFNNLKSGVEEIPARVNSQYTKLKELQDSLVESSKLIKNLKAEKNELTNQLNEEKKQRSSEKTEKSNLIAKADQYDKAYDIMVNDYILNSVGSNNSTIEMMKKQLHSTGAFMSTISKLEEFKKESIELEKAVKLIRSTNISKDDFVNAQACINKLIVSTNYLGLQKLAKELKADYDLFLDLAIQLNKTIADNKTIGEGKPEFHAKVFKEDFKAYAYALKPYPYLESKYNDALTNPKCDIEILLK